MPKKCVKEKMAGGMTRAAAMKACYKGVKAPEIKKYPSRKQVESQAAKRVAKKMGTRKMGKPPQY